MREASVAIGVVTWHASMSNPSRYRNPTVFGMLTAVSVAVILVVAGAIYVRGRVLGEKLSSAIDLSDLRSIRSLVSSGAPVEARGKSGFTALMVAIRDKDRALASDLVGRGANVNQGVRDMTVIWFADDPNSIALLVAYGADVNAGRPNDGATPLMSAVATGNHDRIKALIQAGAKPEIRSYEGVTAMDIAKQMGDQNSIRLLMDGKLKDP